MADMEQSSGGPGGRRPIRAVIFDVDGTLIDSNEAHVEAWGAIFEKFGYHIPPHDIQMQMGKGGDQFLPVFLSEEQLRRDGPEIEKQRKELFSSKYIPKLKPFPCVRELFERLRADGKRLVLASSAEEEELHRYAGMAGVEDLIENATSRGDVEHSKPHPDIFAAALAKLPGCERSEVLVVGDSPYDAEAAGKLGLGVIGLLCGGFPESRLREAGCIAIYESPSDLLERYASSPLAR